MAIREDYIMKQRRFRLFGKELQQLLYGIISQTMIRDNTTGKGFVNLAKVINSKTMYQEVDKFIQRLKGK